MPWTRFEAIVDGAIVASDPAAAAAQERAAARGVFARPTRATRHGVRGFHIRAPFPVISLLDARVAWFAGVLKALGDERTLDERRAAAVAILADPPAALALMRRFKAWRDRPEDPPMPPADDSVATKGSATGQETNAACPSCGVEPLSGDAPVVDWPSILPVVRLHLHFYPGQSAPRGAEAAGAKAAGTGPPQAGEDPPGRDPDPPPRWHFDRDVGAVVRTEGDGPVTTEWVRHFLAKDARFEITPVLDLAGQAPVDAYEIPSRHRQAVHLVSPADVFPWGTSLSRRKEIDHTVPFVHGPPACGAAQSRFGNYGPLSRFHHRLKTHAGWKVQQPFPGIYVWRDPYGGFYLVDHTGTRGLSDARRRAEREASSRVEWAFHETALEYDLTA